MAQIKYIVGVYSVLRIRRLIQGFEVLQINKLENVMVVEQSILGK